ncbi:NTP transferase domain-containing protein [Holdemania filiformis]|uniref:NTP transferase domain-containing protein n=1 Tax=Holdemania filiformis TaxID=61171 RepID=UPI0026767684|nr:NTP transferase domain-containing protein [Holdemania filiformis]
MGYKVDNAIIMAAGLSSRFAPLSYEMPKSLIQVKGEILIERQIRQLQNAGIRDIYVVVGYKKEKFSYLEKLFNVKLIDNPAYEIRNNNSTIKVVEKYLGNSYICSSDNYFMENPFENVVEEAYYATVYAPGETKEWCVDYDEDGWITNVVIGGNAKWYMLGHVFWTEQFSKRFIKILNKVYDEPQIADMLWESIYMQHLDELKLKIRKYPKDYIFEFDTLDELRDFDETYKTNARSKILHNISINMDCREEEIASCLPFKNKKGEIIGFSFNLYGKYYTYNYFSERLIESK